MESWSSFPWKALLPLEHPVRMPLIPSSLIPACVCKGLPLLQRRAWGGAAFLAAAPTFHPPHAYRMAVPLAEVIDLESPRQGTEMFRAN